MDMSLEQISQKETSARRASGGKATRRTRSGGNMRTTPYQNKQRSGNQNNGNNSNGGKREFGVYVGNLPWSFSWQSLKDMFKPYGNVIYAG